MLAGSSCHPFFEPGPNCLYSYRQFGPSKGANSVSRRNPFGEWREGQSAGAIIYLGRHQLNYLKEPGKLHFAGFEFAREVMAESFLHFCGDLE